MEKKIERRRRGRESLSSFFFGFFSQFWEKTDFPYFKRKICFHFHPFSFSLLLLCTSIFTRAMHGYIKQKTENKIGISSY